MLAKAWDANIEDLIRDHEIDSLIKSLLYVSSKMENCSQNDFGYKNWFLNRETFEG